MQKPIWFSLPVWRLVAEEDWERVALKSDRIGDWIVGIEDDVPGWWKAVILKGGGRVATREFCEGTREYFADQRSPRGSVTTTVLCEGATGLIAGRLGKHRCAKGEILTIQAEWRQDRILIGGGGWLVPMGNARFKAGATYTWDALDGEPTHFGRAKISEVIRRLGGENFEVIAHEAGVRPIIRKSQPVIGPLSDGRVVFNGLGSKGSLYAPGVARRLAEWLGGDSQIEADLDVRNL